jgi:WD40 repeat protein
MAFWDRSTSVYILKGRRTGGGNVALSADGRTLASECDSGLQLWRGLPKAPLVVRPGLQSGPLTFAPDGRLFLDGPTPGIYDPDSDTFIPFPPVPTGFRSHAPAPDGTFVLVTLMPGRAAPGGCRVERWPADRVGSGNPTWSAAVPRGNALRPAPLPDGRFVLAEYGRTAAAGEDEYVLTVRSADTGAVLSESRPSAWGPDRGFVAATGEWAAGVRDNLIKAWSLTDLSRPPVELTTGSRKMFTRCAFHPSGAYLAASSTDGTVKFFETGTLSLARTYDWKVGKVETVTFSGDGLLAAAGGEAGRIVVWDVDL